MSYVESRAINPFTAKIKELRIKLSAIKAQIKDTAKKISKATGSAQNKLRKQEYRLHKKAFDLELAIWTTKVNKIAKAIKAAVGDKKAKLAKDLTMAKNKMSSIKKLATRELRSKERQFAKASDYVVTARAKLSLMEKKINWLLRELEVAGVKMRGPKRIVQKNGIVLDLSYGKKFKVTTTGRIHTTPEVKDSGFGKKLLSLNKMYNREFPREAAVLEQGEAPELNRSYKPAPAPEVPAQRATEPAPTQSPRGWSPEKRAQQAQRMRERQAKWAAERNAGKEQVATRAPRAPQEEPVMRRSGTGDFSVDYKRASQRYSGPQSGMDFDIGTRAVPEGISNIDFYPESPGAGPAREARRQRAFMDQYANLDDNRITDDGGYGEYASSKKVRRVKAR